MNYYQRLRDIRNDKELNQTEIAVILETTQEQVSKWERGEQMMGIDKYIKLSRFYNISLDYICGIIDTPRTIDGKPYNIKNMTQINGSNNKVTNIKGNNNKINIKNT